VRIEGPGLDQTASPALSLVGASTQAVATPAIVSGPTTDVYLVLLNVDPVAGTVSLRLTVQPFMSWLWVGGLLVAVGGLVALGPRSRPRAASSTSRERESVPVEATA
jgi:cytochrome c-type biogenesis protein CcmF